jgi:hypothetical protein
MSTANLTQYDICEANKSPPKLPRAPLGVMPVGAPLDRNATDLLGPLPETPLLLNLSVCPLHLGFLGLVRVFLISKISHNCLKISLSKFLPWSECMANGHPSLHITSFINKENPDKS